MEAQVERVFIFQQWRRMVSIGCRSWDFGEERRKKRRNSNLSVKDPNQVCDGWSKGRVFLESIYKCQKMDSVKTHVIQ